MGHTKKQLLLFFGTLAVRLPFLVAGYGVEEDSWGHVWHAALMHESGMYEVSRLPGHPLYEALLLVMWNVHTPLLYNLPSALAMAVAVTAFYRIAVLHHIKHAFWWSIVFGFIPTLFISSTYTIDYCLTLLFSLLSYEAALKNKSEASGIWLAIAAGFRITALGMLLPIGYFLLNDTTVHQSIALRLRSVFKVFVLSFIIAFIFYLPPFFQYGLAFFDFHRPPYPIWPEILYKMSIGVWGVLGVVALCIAGVFLVMHRKRLQKDTLHGVLLLTVFVYGTAYFRMPEKAAFWIPVVPFVLLFMARNLPNKTGALAGTLMVLSGWFLGINTRDQHTGAAQSTWAQNVTIAGEAIFIDPLYGPIINDFSKREIKAAACKQIEQELMRLTEPSVIIAGWWYAMLEVNQRDGSWSNNHVALVYFASPEELAAWKAKGYRLRYLPEQERINDMKYNTTYTVTNATLLPIP